MAETIGLMSLATRSASSGSSRFSPRTVKATPGAMLIDGDYTISSCVPVRSDRSQRPHLLENQSQHLGTLAAGGDDALGFAVAAELIMRPLSIRARADRNPR